MRTSLLAGASLALVLSLASSAYAEDKKDNSEGEKALKARAAEFVAAFNKGDAAAVAAFWTEDGDYVDQLGRRRAGRKVLEAAFKKMFKERKGARLRITVLGVRFLTPDCALEDGFTEVLPPDGGPPTSARYTIVHVKKDGKWHLASVRETIATPPSNHEHLEALDWLAGEWTEDAKKGEVVKLSYTWAHGQNFLVGEFATTLKDVAVNGGVQWIGWDAAAKRVRSWTFDSSGGFNEAAWTRDGDRWTIKVTGTLRDGKKLSSINILTKVDGDHATWQSTDRMLDGKALPEIKPIKLKRVKVTAGSNTQPKE